MIFVFWMMIEHSLFCSLQQTAGGNVPNKTPEIESIPTPVARLPNTNLQPMGEVVTNVITSANWMSETRQNILPGMYALNAPTIR